MNEINLMWEDEKQKVPGLAHPFSQMVKDYAIAVSNGSNVNFAKNKLQKEVNVLSNTESYLYRYFHVFVESILKEKTESGNLYKSTDMLKVFNTLYDSSELIKFGHDTVNGFVLENAPQNENITIVDIGFGSGLQWEQLVRQYGKFLRIIAIDLPTEINKEFFNRFNTKWSAELLEFIPILKSIEDVDLLELSNDSYTIVNASFTLHHILPDEIQEKNGRQNILNKIRAMQPDLFTLVEPDSNHNSLSKGATIIEVFAHYMTVFKELDISLGDNPDLHLIENSFFGREIKNILGNTGPTRVERHERYSQWCVRLQKALFKENSKREYKCGEKTLIAASSWVPLADGLEK